MGIELKNNNIVHDKYRLEDLRETFSVVSEKDGVCFCVNISQSEWVNFAVLEFASSNSDGTDREYECFWYGEGPSGSLRELRHSWFGSSPKSDDGYVFYINRSKMNTAFDFLSEYFDVD